uniref:Uncharacterized protein n=1 Tax=Chromera velia CCMP2878 TaxID=1169474 RepID=A0A0G4HIH4_9ALVE|eukprot:Cvel_27789.t1-p1 / transcript=Cvel_27789.t1 / gene=Cvel_27789 / organism=Chromera_velia_CCMP2878 / gene_product=hypothetical protein / transcript_product=hypothetical protein / location=Cvel_scaffold3526:7961-12918(-) / protein_length=143 / sequence_SO=supercontig / SO=protein_coding / is_pseudo=false
MASALQRHGRRGEKVKTAHEGLWWEWDEDSEALRWELCHFTVFARTVPAELWENPQRVDAVERLRIPMQDILSAVRDMYENSSDLYTCLTFLQSRVLKSPIPPPPTDPSPLNRGRGRNSLTRRRETIETGSGGDGVPQLPPLE